MSRDYKKLEVFTMADQLVIDVYRVTKSLPLDERYGLQAQLRRASVSVPCNIVEGSARSSNKDYAHFLRIALGSATEARYLFNVVSRLGFLPADVAAGIEQRYDRLVRATEVLAQRVEATHREEVATRKRARKSGKVSDRRP